MQTVLVGAWAKQQPTGCVLLGAFAYRGAATDGYPALHTILVNDLRQRSGDTASMARVIAALPFNDTGDSTAFADNYGCQATVRHSET
jgi:hypothetical protein